jgi:hypothetical protein
MSSKLKLPSLPGRAGSKSDFIISRHRSPPHEHYYRDRHPTGDDQPGPAAAEHSGSRDYLSYSAVSLYQTCPLRYFYKYVEGRPEESVAASLVFGAAFHAALEHHYQNLLAADEPPGLDVLLDVFWGAWQARAAGTVVFGRGEDVSSVAGLIDRTLRTFLASDLAEPAGTIIGVEEELRASVIPGCPDLLARLDLLVDTKDSLLVLDFKTARSRWNPARLADAAPQLHLYAELAQPLAEGKPLRLAFAVMTKAKRSPTLTLHTVPHDPEEISLTLRSVERTWQSIGDGDFEPRPSPIHCPRCPYRQDCRAWTGARQ